MATSMKFTIVQFEDGLAIVPSFWLNENEMKCAYPNTRDTIKINKAVFSLAVPKDNWKKYNILRIFYRTNSEDRAKEKLVAAKNLSDLTADENTENETKNIEKEKKSRHMRAKKIHSSSEECELNSDESENATKLSPLPKIPHKLWVANNRKASLSELVSPPSSSINVLERSKSEGPMNSVTQTKSLYKEATTNSYTERRYRDNLSDENGSFQNTEKEFQKEVIRKLQSLLHKMTALENRMILLETTSITRHKEEEAANVILYEEYDLPLQNMQALERLEQLLKDSSFADKMVNTLKLAGGINLSNIIPNMLKKLLSDHFAQTFSYLGQRNKSNFSALKLCSIVKKVVRIHKPESNDTQIAEVISNWLVHAKWREQRAEAKMKKQQQREVLDEAEDAN